MRKAELRALTGVRFYAALFVFFSHMPIVAGMDALSGQRAVFNAGVVGVSFFFVLSGFILTYNYAHVFEGGISPFAYRRFLWDRFTKIYPVHVATLVLVLPVALFSQNLPLDWRAVPFHLLLLHCFWPFAQANLGAYLNVPAWSISCEWFFYLVAPFAMFLVLGALRRRLLLVSVMAVYGIGLGLFLWNGQSDYIRLTAVSWFAPTRLPEFLVGMFLGRAYLMRSEPEPSIFAGPLQAAGVLLIVAGAMYRAHAPWPFWGGLLYLPGSALLVAGLAWGPGILGAHLSHNWLNRLGIASFSFYLVHAPILRIAKGMALHFGWEVHSWGAFCLVAAGMFMIAQTAALIMCNWYEIPAQRYLRSLMKRASEHRDLDANLQPRLAKV
jgi:peptidoglycan/LPS O-acetylase OafA/YrhL